MADDKSDMARQALDAMGLRHPNPATNSPQLPEPHSEFPIPRSWSQAWPIILWGMLAFSFVLVFAESLLALIENPMLRAGMAGVSLIGVTAMLIYRQTLLAKFRNPTAAQIILTISTVLLVIALSPFVEERRWPFLALFASQDNTEAQKATLIEWLRGAQAERDLARQALDAAKALQPPPADITQLIDRLRAQLNSKTQELENAKRELETFRHPPSSGMPTWLELEFSGAGELKEKGSSNLRWVYWNEKGSSAIADPLNLYTYRNPLSTTSETVRRVIIFLSFDAAIDTGRFSITSEKPIIWDHWCKDNKICYVWFDGRPENLSVTIRVGR
jgi:hypothetical protein